MVMLRKRKMILALVNSLPALSTIGSKSNKGKTKKFEPIDEFKFLYGQLGLYDRIIDYMIKAGV